MSRFPSEVNQAIRDLRLKEQMPLAKIAALLGIGKTYVFKICKDIQVNHGNDWHDEAVRMRLDGADIETIASHFGKKPHTVYQVLREAAKNGYKTTSNKKPDTRNFQPKSGEPDKKLLRLQAMLFANELKREPAPVTLPRLKFLEKPFA